MRLWVALYAMIWLVLLQIWLGYTPLAPPVPQYAHVVLGVALVGLAYLNFGALRRSTAPGRVKRTARATLALCLFMIPLGVALFFHVGASWVVAWGVTFEGGVRFLHFVVALAIFSQVSATAVVYDVWEEREFVHPTTPGEIPPPPPAT